MKNILSAAMIIAVVAAPTGALAQSHKHQPGGEPSGAVRAAQYSKVLKWCRDKYSNGSDVRVEWGARFGKTTWWCLHR